jgi:SPX domain protein involved in polyphosphate accumulation
MFKDLIKRFKKDAKKYDLVKHRPQEAQSPDQQPGSEESPVSSLRFFETEAKPILTAAPRLQENRDLPVPLSPSRKGDLLACRFELKYRISESKAQAIRDYVRNYLPMDHYAMNYPEGQYPISSLYFDSSNLDLCKETLAGKASRFKLRIRAYDDASDSSVFFEIKRRANKVILKSRARIRRPDLLSALDGTLENSGRSLKDQEALKQFLYYHRMIQGRPVVLVRYMREPFEGDTENRVRVTFDRNLCYRPISVPEVTLNGHGWQRIELPFVILEIKFTEQYPSWLHDMICTFNLNLSSMSKYVTSVKQSHRDAFSYYLE